MKSRWWSDSQSVSAGQCILLRFHGDMGNSTFCQQGLLIDAPEVEATRFHLLL